MPAHRHLIFMALYTFTWSACSTNTSPANELQPSYSEHIAPMVAEHCAACHQPGGAGPFDLSNYTTLKAMANVSLNAIETGRMPPWHASDDCNEYVNDASLSAEEKALFRRWVETGLPEGPAQPPAPEAEAPIPAAPTHQLELAPAEPYQPNPALNDDYRCIPVAETLAEETYVRGLRVVPGATELVHHVIVKSIPPDQADVLEAKDEADPGPGYSCFGTEFLPGSTFVGGWVPGARKGLFEPNTAYVLPAGSRLVMEIHYNLLAAPSQPDLTRIRLITSPTAPAYEAVNRFLVNTDLRIEAGKKDQRHEVIIPVPSGDDLEIVAVSPHMHLLGTHQRLELLREDGSSSCLVDIPDWDFDWQRSYGFYPDRRPKMQAGDRLKLSCVYDNSPGNQPLINGEPVTPRDVTWGEGTLDEMCLNTLTYRRPFQPSEETEGMSCLEALMCFEGCTDGDDNCDLACYLGVRPESQPALNAFVACYQREGCTSSACAQDRCGEEINSCISN